MEEKPVLLSVGDAAKLTQIPKRTLYNWIRGGLLEAFPPYPGELGARVDMRRIDTLSAGRSVSA